MTQKTSNSNLVLAVVHLLLGALFLVGGVTKIYSTLVLLFGILFIIKAKNKHNEAMMWAAYMVGAEVLFRMTKGLFFYELPKYSVLLFLFTGLIVEKRKHPVPVSYIIYTLLLLISIAFLDIPFNESIRKAIAFNLSGPVLLGVSAIYFYRRKLSLDTLLRMLFIMVLPIISMLSLLFFKTRDISEIRFSSNANFSASGGYGPNQVATILGLGIFIFLIHLFFKKRIFSLFLVDVFFFIYVIYRGVITFSRGGMITAILAIGAFVFFYSIASKNKLQNLLKYALLSGVLLLALGVYTSYITSGMIINRYTNKNSAGIAKKDISTGRIKLFVTEMEAFFENPFFGIGVGGSKFYRQEKLNKLAASHNEVSRLLSEHGMIGILILMLLLGVSITHILNQPYLARAFLSAFLIFWFLTINHSAMRIAFPGFIYGLSVAVITLKNENTLYR